MIIYYDKRTGDIIGTVEGFEEHNEDMTISTTSCPADQVGKKIIRKNDEMADQARRFEDPREPDNIHEHKVRIGKGGRFLALDKKVSKEQDSTKRRG